MEQKDNPPEFAFVHFGRVSACGSSGTGQSLRCVGALGTACACVHKLASRIDRIGLQEARRWLGDCKARRQAKGACARGERATRRPIRRFLHSCAQAAEEKFHGARTILFMIGGMTYSEMRTAYDFSEQHNREAIVGAPAALRSTYHCRFMEGRCWLQDRLILSPRRNSCKACRICQHLSSLGLRPPGTQEKDASLSAIL